MSKIKNNNSGAIVCASIIREIIKSMGYRKKDCKFNDEGFKSDNDEWYFPAYFYIQGKLCRDIQKDDTLHEAIVELLHEYFNVVQLEPMLFTEMLIYVELKPKYQLKGYVRRKTVFDEDYHAPKGQAS